MSQMDISFKRINKRDYKEAWIIWLSTGWNNNFGITQPEFEKIWSSSFLCIGAMEKNELVGIGRLLSDGCLYGMVYDVVVKETKRNKGIGKGLIEAILNHPLAKDIKVFQLMAAVGTNDFYRKSGFVPRPSDAPGMVLERLKP